ncbi:MAG: hypothetical protein LAO23_14320 [Acidobacteriia bacterium]|nr:hypothetical protein [Terriglobia bacterium]
MSPGLAAFILVVIFIVGWFAVGTHYNVRKGHAALRWLQEGLPLVGEKTTLRWLGSSVLELKIQQAKPPFRHAEVLVVLEPRDVAPLWGLAHLRGRRDLFIFRAALRTQPEVELEALDPASWPPQELTDRAKNYWTPLSAAPPLIAYAPGNLPAASKLLSRAALDGCPLQRLLVRRTEPNLEVQWRFDPLRTHSARAVFETLLRITEGS